MALAGTRIPGIVSCIRAGNLCAAALHRHSGWNHLLPRLVFCSAQCLFEMRLSERHDCSCHSEFLRLHCRLDFLAKSLGNFSHRLCNPSSNSRVRGLSCLLPRTAVQFGAPSGYARKIVAGWTDGLPRFILRRIPDLIAFGASSACLPGLLSDYAQAHRGRNVCCFPWRRRPCYLWDCFL